MTLDALLHIIGFGFVIALWLTAMVGIGAIWHKARAALDKARPGCATAAPVKRHLLAAS